MNRLTREALLEAVDECLDICPKEGTDEECFKHYSMCTKCSEQALADYEEEIRKDEREKILEDIKKMLFTEKESK